jgi:hypothetical protein
MKKRTGPAPRPHNPYPHPAKFSANVLSVLADMMNRAMPDMGGDWSGVRVLDPFAGVGGIHELSRRLPGLRTLGIELEPEWAKQAPNKRVTIVGDSRKLSEYVGTECYEFVLTSACYGNRMADSHNARERCRNCAGTGVVDNVDRVMVNDGHGDVVPIYLSCVKCDGKGFRVHKRHTYTHYLGRQLNEFNAGKMQYGPDYRKLHFKVWRECYKVLVDGGWLFLNMKNHIRGGVEVDVVGFHKKALRDAGFQVSDVLVPVDTPHMGHGENRDDRCVEVIIVAQKIAKQKVRTNK